MAVALSVPPFACVWGVRWLLGGLHGVRHLHIRVLPLLAVLSALTFAGILLLGGDDITSRLGHRTVWSVGLSVSTWAFALFSVLGFVAAVRVRRSEVNRWVFLHSLVASTVFCMATVYLARFGVIGLRTWV